MTNMQTTWLIKALLLGGIFLRLALFWVNPVVNAFDDHYTPIFMIAQKGGLVGKLDCWECYQPPVFYVLSALWVKGLHIFGLNNGQIMKVLQFFNCLYGIATLWVLHLILGKFPLSNFSRVIAFGTLCFLPRHIYMGVLHSNDTFSYLTVALCIYLLLLVVEGKRTLFNFALLSAMVSAAIFTKYTAFSLIPVIAATFALLVLPPYSLPSLEAVKKAGLVLLFPLLILAGYMLENKQQYGTALPFNTALYDPVAHQPQDPGGANFISFEPWLFVQKPILWPGQLSSFWTLIHSGMWFDSEAKFLPYLKDEPESWWLDYYRWLMGQSFTPPHYTEGIKSIRWTGSMLVALGLVPLFLILTGVGHFLVKLKEAIRTRCWHEIVPLQILAGLLVLNVVGILQLAMKTPVYSAMKPSYLLASLPAFGVFLALGVMVWEKRKGFRIACGSFFAVLFLLVSFNILDIVLAFP